MLKGRRKMNFDVPAYRPASGMDTVQGRVIECTIALGVGHSQQVRLYPGMVHVIAADDVVAIAKPRCLDLV
ncbi:hypothetical protein D3C87_1687920 [compost metagenome]